VHFLRHRLPRLAALVLLVWLFAAGTAFAQACVSTAHVLCEECCAEEKAATPTPEQRLDIAASTAGQPWITASAVAGTFAHAAQERIAFAQEPPGPPARRSIPIVFLRLAL
jgi:hypothetical protein